MVLFEDTDRLAALLKTLEDSPHSRFYRHKLLATGSSSAALETLPMLTRAELVSVHPDDRCYVAQEDVAFVAYTSGTSSGSPLLTYFGETRNYFLDPGWGTGVRRPLIVFPPLNKNFCGTFIQQCRQAPEPMLPILGDPQNVAASAYLGRVLNADALYATPTLALALAPHLTEQGVIRNIKLLAISGETVTDVRLAELRSSYPNAFLANLYASSEIGQFVMGPSLPMLRDGVVGFVPNVRALIAAELVDNELVITCAQNPAFPLLRYRTGDLFEVSPELTRQYGDGLPVLTWLGKGGVDMVRVGGFELRAGTLEQLMLQCAPTLEHYQLHIYPAQGSAVARFVLECLVSDEPIAPSVVQHIHETLLERLQLTAGMSVYAALAQGHLESFVVEPVTQLSWSGVKRRILINHLV